MLPYNIMSIAEAYIGTHEEPMGSNNVIFNTDYYGHPVYGSAYPWCCAFVWDIFRMAGASNLFYDGQKTAYCPSVYNWGRNRGLIIPYEQAQYGDVVLFDWDADGEADHIGFVEGMNSDGSLCTLEGNTSDSDHSNGGWVLYRTRYRQHVMAIIRPEYSTGGVYHMDLETVYEGCQGESVLMCQKLLACCGLYTSTFDGSAGSKTAAGIIAFQKILAEEGVISEDEINGVCGEITWDNLVKRHS